MALTFARELLRQLYPLIAFLLVGPIAGPGKLLGVLDSPEPIQNQKMSFGFANTNRPMMQSDASREDRAGGARGSPEATNQE